MAQFGGGGGGGGGGGDGGAVASKGRVSAPQKGHTP